ncbi:hypothetical protein LTS18_011674, partial [Coniosporium uncinatum]
MLLQALEDGNLKNMHLAHYTETVLFQPTITYPTDDNPRGSMEVTFKPADGSEPKTITIPLRPDTANLQIMDVNMHQSPCKAYNMGSEINQWFSSCFGYPVVMAYLGEHLRPVLMSTSGNGQAKSQQSSSSWLGSITKSLPTSILGYGGQENEEKEQVTFADCASYLVVSETSMKDVLRRLPEGEEVDIIKFRPNIIVAGAEKEWEEDYWAELDVGGNTIPLSHNCVRCVSINIDYTTGKPGKTESGTILKKMMKDRRVDQGMKYSPVFGRYGFLAQGEQGGTVKVGDEVNVTRKNEERTTF